MDYTFWKSEDCDKVALIQWMTIWKSRDLDMGDKQVEWCMTGLSSGICERMLET